MRIYQRLHMEKMISGINIPAGPVRDPIFIAADRTTIFGVPLGTRYFLECERMLYSEKEYFTPTG